MTTYYGTGAVASSCPHNVRCGQESNPSYDPNYQPLFPVNTAQTLYIETDEYALIITPLDTGGGLAPNQIDLYVGIMNPKMEQPQYPANRAGYRPYPGNPRVWRFR
jgi:3D (Asp-Asp-Asp) domain-containing protein